MAVDKLVDSSQLNADLTSVANAIRTKGGTSASLAFPAEFVSAIAAIPTGGGGGNATIQAGTFTLASAITVANSGTTINVGFSGHPNFIYIWLDKDSFEAVETPSNNHYFRIVLMRNKPEVFETVPPIRYSASLDVQSMYSDGDYLQGLSVTTYDSSDANNTKGKAATALVYYNRNNDINAINDDGTITVARYSTATSYWYAGTYHYVAITSPLAFWPPV